MYAPAFAHCDRAALPPQRNFDDACRRARIDAEWRLVPFSEGWIAAVVNLRRIVAVLWLGLLGPGTAAQAAWPPAVTAYLDALSATEQADPPASLEPLFQAAEEAQEALMQVDGSGQGAWIESLDEDDYASLSQQLRGLRLSRGRDVYAQPDPNFLSELAQRQGRDEDREFFRMYRRSWGNDLIPSYLRLTTRVTPCVRFGENVIPALYDGWRAYRLRFPLAYMAYTEQTVRDLEEAVELGTCACGGRDSVEQELSAFVTRFPDTPSRPAILARLQELEDDPERRPVQCR